MSNRNALRLAAVAAAFALAPTLLRADTPAPGFPVGFEQSTVFKSGTDGYLFYRIPSAVVTTKGTLLIFCEGRRSEWGPHADSGEINVLVKRSTDNGNTFGKQQVVWADGPNTCGNPTAVVDKTTGTIVVLMSHNPGDYEETNNRAARSVWITTSDDDGVTWSTPRDLTSIVKKPEWVWYATGPGVGIQLERGSHAGRLVIPCNHSVKAGDGSEGGQFSHVIYSDDHGKTWHLGGQSTAGFNESEVVELADGTVMLNMRNAKVAGRAKGAAKLRGIALSTDGGATFATPYADPTLIEPVCQGSIVRYDWPTDGKPGHLLFANPASDTERTNMTVRISADDGKSWPFANLVHKGWSCYSSIVPLPDGKVALVYEAGDRARYDRLDMARMTMNWIASGPPLKVAPSVAATQPDMGAR